MFEKPNVYKMGQGEYIDEKNVEELADRYFADDPIIKSYNAGVYETEGNKKNHLYFEYELIELDRIINEFDPEQHDETNDNINKFLYEVTGRTADHRRGDMKKQTRGD